MDHTAKFWDRIAERYARRPVADEGVYQRKLALTRERLRPEMQLLEFGCGTGSTAIVHAPHVKHIHAIDVSAKMLGIARARAEVAGVRNITFTQAGIDQFRVADATYDMVLGLSILHLLEDRHAAIAKVFKMLRPGGWFVSSTVCLGDTMAFFKFVAPIGRVLGLLPVLRVFTTKELVASIAAAGFEIETEWLPGKGKAVFVIARKPLENPAPA